ncbi:MAG: hypothetical protein CMO40_09180 [Verrucomicrobiaceae bacterium]|nr:hypothetical protein [Verrucomicrobiaceae bacterium]
MKRRNFLASSSVCGAAFFTGASCRAAPRISMLDTKVVSQLPELYHGWPTLARRSNGELLLVCSGGREEHVCPFGRTDFRISHDGGESWSFPRVVMDGPIDDRDAGVLETAQGSILVTNFTSLAYEPMMGGKGARWHAAHHRTTAQGRQEALGTWMIRSTNGGLSFSGRYRVPVNSPHGPVQLRDGRLLYAGKALWTEKEKVGVCESKDDGKTWSWLADIPTREQDNHHEYHELHLVEAASGDLVVQIRNHNRLNSRETLQCESKDGGRTWTTPHSIGVWGLPSHLLRLRDNRLLMSYGHRRSPFGNQVRISEDEGKTWSSPLIISGDGRGGDLGYPSTVERDDGVLVTVWYEKMAGTRRAVLRQARWQLG